MNFSDALADMPFTHERGAVVALDGRAITIELFERNSRLGLLLESEGTWLKAGDRITAHIESGIGAHRVMIEKGDVAYFAKTLAN